MYPCLSSRALSLPFILILCAIPVASLPASLTASYYDLCYDHGQVWMKLITFIATSFVAHAASVPGTAGGTWLDTTAWIIIALFLPLAGMWRSIIFISNFVLLHKNRIERACARGAVIALSRTKLWRPSHDREDTVYAVVSEGLIQMPESVAQNTYVAFRILYDYDTDDTAANCTHATPSLRQEPAVQWDHYQVSGEISKPPPGYEWVALESPTVVCVMVSSLDNADSLAVACSRDLAKMTISVIQLVYACFTLYRTRGDQIDLYGYAAYGLAVIPYAVMSLVNFITVGITGDYPSKYVLQSTVLQEALSRWTVPSFRCDGAIGTLRQDLDIPSPGKKSGGIASQTMGSRENLLDDARQSSSSSNIPESWRFRLTHMQIEYAPPAVPDQPYSQFLRIRLRDSTLRFRMADETTPPDNVKWIGVSAYTNQLRVWDPVVLESIRKMVPSLAIYLVASLIPIFMAYALPYLLIYVLSGFSIGKSTFQQRTMFIGWIVSGQVATFLVYYLMRRKNPVHKFLLSWKGIVVFSVLLAIPIGGYISLAKMYISNNEAVYNRSICVNI